MTLGPGLHRTRLPIGFTASGVNSGVRRYRPDLGILISDRDAVAVGVFTQNQCKAAPVIYCQGLLPAHDVRAIVTNSGQANAATGEEGVASLEVATRCLQGRSTAMAPSSHKGPRRAAG